MEQIVKRLGNLLTIKSLITIFLLVLFSYLACVGKVVPEDVTEIFKLVVVFYFGTQAEKISTAAKNTK